MTTAGVVVAMEWEAEALGRAPMRFELAGTGPERARAAAERLLRSGVHGLVSWGAAAGLDPRLAPGTLLLPAMVLGADGRRHPVDRQWRDRVVRVLSDLHPVAEPLAETADLLDEVAAKGALRQRTGAAAADMESASVLRVAAQADLPGLVIRVVLDSAASRVPRPWAATVGSTGRLQPARLMVTLLRPTLWTSGIGLARCRGRARRTLRAAAAGLQARPATEPGGEAAQRTGSGDGMTGDP